MDWVHLHLILNHVPVVGTVIAVVVYLTGEPTEEAVEGLAGFSEAAMESHEGAALVATIVAAMAGLAALGGVFAFRRSDAFPGWAVALVLLVALASIAAMAYTANLGGAIRHSEIRGDAQARLPAAEHEEEEER